MDFELFITLLIFWVSSTASIVTFMSMWFFNEGESFHPHSVDIDHRHALYVVAHSDTLCKHDCCVKSISAFVAPRGSSSSKQFTVLCAMISVSGFLGTYRWYIVNNNGNPIATLFALAGFASLLLVAIFELDVTPERFLDDKLMVTRWFIEKLKMQSCLDFNMYDKSKLLEFLRISRTLYPLYEEDLYVANRSGKFKKFTAKNNIWESLHMMGAIGFVFLVTASVLMTDGEEQKVAWITGVTFFFFSFLGYLTGTYIPLISPLKGWILLWNPFVNDPYFLYHLKCSILEYQETRRRSQAASISNISYDNSSSTFIEKNTTRNKSNGKSVTAAAAVKPRVVVTPEILQRVVPPSPLSNSRTSSTSRRRRSHTPNYQNNDHHRRRSKSTRHEKTLNNTYSNNNNNNIIDPDTLDRPFIENSKNLTTKLSVCDEQLLLPRHPYNDPSSISTANNNNNNTNHHSCSTSGCGCCGMVSKHSVHSKTCRNNSGSNSNIISDSKQLNSSDSIDGRHDCSVPRTPLNKHHPSLLTVDVTVGVTVTVTDIPNKEDLNEVNKLALDNIALRFAYKYPKLYLTIAGHLLVMTELVALLTPTVAMGIQWVTALCEGPATWALVDMIQLALQCVFSECHIDNHCIVKTTH